MTQDASWNRIKELFQAVIERPPDDREAFLEDACGNDRVLKQKVESLLTAHAEAGGFAERPAMDVLTELPGGAGAYQLLSLIGAGGMGEVYRARDMTLGRDVAIKILPPIFVVDPDRLLRFDREARVLASLSHPNICAIHGIADINGTPGLVLELVDGRTLAELIAAAATRRRRTSASSAERRRAQGNWRFRGADHRARRRACPGSRARKRHHPSRPQARQHQDHRGRRRQSARLWTGEGERRQRARA